MLITPQNSDFNLERATELLLLVEKAHDEFNEAQTNDKWNWYKDKKLPVGLDSSFSDYQVIQRFGFGEYFWSLTNILTADIMNLMEGIKDRVPFGFVAQKGNEVFVVFRGTMTPAEWITNFQFKPGHLPFLNQENLGQVHKGFYKIYTRKDIGKNPASSKDDLPAIKDDIEMALKACPKEAQVYVTGHSLGGALATLATLHIRKLEFFNSPPILYTFANPRAGNRKFASNFNGLQCFRITNSEDIVPTVPLASVEMNAKTFEGRTAKSLEKATLSLPFKLSDLDYQHIGEPIYFTISKGGVADNHIIPTYKEALSID